MLNDSYWYHKMRCEKTISKWLRIILANFNLISIVSHLGPTSKKGININTTLIVAIIMLRIIKIFLPCRLRKIKLLNCWNGKINIHAFQITVYAAKYQNRTFNKYTLSIVLYHKSSVCIKCC